MKKTIWIGLFSFLGFSQIGFSQNPGNVGTTNLTAWWKADALSGNVTNWTTTFPTGGSAISVTDASSPFSTATNTPSNSIFNYNTVVDFNGNSSTNDKCLINTAIPNLLTNQVAPDQGTFFVVFASPITGSNDGVITYRGSGNSAVQVRGFGRLAIGQTNSTDGTREFGVPPVAKQTMVSYYGDKSSSTSMNAYLNGGVVSASSSSSAVTRTNNLTFGGKRNVSPPFALLEYFGGYIGEVLFYNVDLSTPSDLSKVHSYLALKFGITLDNTGGGAQGDYLSSNGTLVWDASVNPGYHNDVIGIARDDNQALLQKQSHAWNDTTRVYISTLASTNNANSGSISANGAYLVMRHNNGLMYNTSIPAIEIPACGVYARLQREWKVTKTNFSDNFNWDVKLSAAAAPGSVNAADLRLLIDDDGDFSNGGTTCYFNGDGSGAVISYSNPTITVANISNAMLANNSTRYITIASASSVTPLPIELLNLNAAPINNRYVELDWQTATEINNDFFTIEKSKDGSHFEYVTTVDGAGSSTTVQQYSAIDENPYIGVSYYRLKQTDFDGKYEYSDVLVVQYVKEDEVKIFPNPLDGTTFYLSRNGTYGQEVLVVLYDPLGTEVFLKTIVQQEGPMLTAIDLHNKLSPGIYLIIGSSRKELFRQKLIVK